MKYFKKLYLILISIFLCTMFPVQAFAASGGEVGYSIKAVMPENQIDKSKSYFDLRMVPNQEQTIEIIVINTSDKEGRFSVSVNQAYTNEQGFIDYSDNDIEPDESMEYKVSDIIEVQNEVIVPANDSVKVPINIKMPEEEFDGQILSAIGVEKELDDSEKNSSGIKNKYGYVLGLKLTETDTEINRELNLKDIKSGVKFNKPSIIATLQNPTMDAYGHLKYEAKVVNKSKNKVFAEISYDNDMELAPNSNYEFAIKLDDDKKIESGDYILELQVSDAKGNQWDFNEEFSISNKEAKESNDLVIRNNMKMPLWAIILIVILIILFILQFIWIFFLKKRKREEENHNYNNKNDN